MPCLLGAYCIINFAAHRPVLDRHPCDAAALLRRPPGVRGGRCEVGGGRGAHLGVERQAHAQLPQAGGVGVWQEGGLEVQRDAWPVRQDLVVDVILRCLPLPAGDDDSIHRICILSEEITDRHHETIHNLFIGIHSSLYTI